MSTKDYSAYLKQLSDAKKRKSIAALQAAYEKSVAQLQQAESGLDGEYRQAKNAAAGQSAQSERNFAQYAAANGLTNGVAGQARLARSVALQNDLAALDREKAGEKADMAARKVQALADYESGAAQAQADAETELAESLYKEQIRREEAAYEAARDAVKDSQWQKEYDYQASRDAAKDEQWQKELDYKASRDAVEDGQWQKELDFAIQKFWYGKGGQTSDTTQSSTSQNTSAGAANPKTLLALANQVLRGEWGNGAERVKRLTEAGYDAAAVQRTVDLILAGKQEQVK